MPAHLDFDELLAPIPGDDPAGAPRISDLKDELDEARKEVIPDSAEGEAMAVEAKEPEWGRVVNLTKDALANRSKHMMLAVRLTEGLTKVHGFSGLRDGLILIRRLLEECLDRLHPKIESDEDKETMANLLIWLDDPNRGAFFPHSIRTVPIVFGAGFKFSWDDKRRAANKEEAELKANFDKAFQAMKPETVATICSDINEALAELKKLKASATTTLGEFGPAMSNLEKAIVEVKATADDHAKKKPLAAEGGGTNVADSGDGEAKTEGGGGGGGSGGQAPGSREAAYNQLQQAADVLRQLEPHSPIPYLIERAVNLGRLAFPQLIKELVRSNDIITELFREFGIKEEEAAGDGGGGGDSDSGRGW
jgi:type VI secretion system protein ImpA